LNRRSHDLIQQYIAGLLNEADAGSLHESLKVDADLRRLYLHYINLDVALEAQANSKNRVNEILMVTPEMPGEPPARWLSWRPLTTATVGLVIGLCSASLVFGFVTPKTLPPEQPTEPRVILVQESFESPAVKIQDGFPSEAGIWGGGTARMVEAIDGVTPVEGYRMLRVEPDSLSTLTYLDRIVDLSDHPLPGLNESRYVEVTASFHAEVSGLRDRYTLRAAAFGEAPGSLRHLWMDVPWRDLEGSTLAASKRGLSTTTETRGWQKITVRVEAPPEARSIVISLAAGLFETPDLRNAHYIDDVHAALFITPQPQKKTQNK